MVINKQILTLGSRDACEARMHRVGSQTQRFKHGACIKLEKKGEVPGGTAYNTARNTLVVTLLLESLLAGWLAG